MPQPCVVSARYPARETWLSFSACARWRRFQQTKLGSAGQKKNGWTRFTNEAQNLSNDIVDFLTGNKQPTQ